MNWLDLQGWPTLCCAPLFLWAATAVADPQHSAPLDGALSVSSGKTATSGVARTDERAALILTPRQDTQGALGLLARAADHVGLDRHLIQAVAWTESAYRPDVVSHKGAMGLMQLMPATARHYGVGDPFDPWQNLQGGARLLRDLLNRYAGDTRLALAAYNAGPAAVEQAGRAVPDYPETQAYVRRVLERQARLQTQANPLTAIPGTSRSDLPQAQLASQRPASHLVVYPPGMPRSDSPVFVQRQIGNALLLTPTRLPRNLPASPQS